MVTSSWCVSAHLTLHARADSALVQNFTVFKSLQPKLEKNVVAFNIVEKDGPVGVRLRLKNAAEAKELHEALLKEVEAASK